MAGEHAPVEERHRERATALCKRVLEAGNLYWEERDAIAQALADEYARGQDDAWDAAIKALRGMQPGPAKVETSFERFSANSKTILDATRAIHDARPRR